jgi:hypothetical protein
MACVSSSDLAPPDFTNVGASVGAAVRGPGTDAWCMDRVVDLDAVLVELTRRRPEWTRRRLVVGEFTWRDAAAAWPQPIVTDRKSVADPESVGMTLDAGDGAEALLVLWTGGWADLETSINGQLVLEAPEFVDVASWVAVADALVARLLGPANSG